MALLDSVRNASKTFKKAEAKYKNLKDKVDVTKAKIQILDSEGKPDSSVKPMIFHYNPAEYKVTREAEYSEPPSRESATQFVQLCNIKPGNLTFSAVFDSYMTIDPEKKDVSDAFQALENLFVVDGDQKLAKKVLLEYGAMSFVGYITNLSIEYTMFTRTGVPVRAKVDISMLLLNPDDALDQDTRSHLESEKDKALHKISDALNLRKGIT